LRGVGLVALGDLGFEVEPLDGDGAAVHPADDALAFEDAQVAADGFGRDTEFGRDVVDVDAAVATCALRQELMPFGGVHARSSPMFARCRLIVPVVTVLSIPSY